MKYEKTLGLKSGKGLKKQIDAVSFKIESCLANLVAFSSNKANTALLSIKITYGIIGLVFLIISIVSAIFISKRVTRSISDLNRKMDDFVKSDFTLRTILPFSNSQNEIDALITNFSVMEQHIVDQMNALKQSNNDLEMLFYVTSHDIKAPLLKVKELTKHAFVKTSDPEIKESLYQINEAWEKLVTISDELGIVTNVRSNSIKTEAINLDELLHSILSEFRANPLFDTIIFSMDIKLTDKFYSSLGLIKAVFRNLIENSINYSTKRKSFSFLKIAIVEHNDEMIRMEFSDNGIGIKKEYLDKIYNMFFRATNYAEGTGLGLYIVKCSLEKLHGAISVESDEAIGTKFTLLVPNNYQRKNIKERIIQNRALVGITQSIENGLVAKNQ